MGAARYTAFGALLLGLACNASGGDEQFLTTSEDAFVGGWDGADTTGPSILLLREGLIGSLTAVSIVGNHFEYELSFAAEGMVEPDGVGLKLVLACAESRTRPTASDAAWTKMDCSGWELQLVCGLAGDCDSGDCNMVCDVVHFGDGYGRAGVSLAEVEDQFDFWERV